MSHFTAYVADGTDGTCRLKLVGEFDISGRELADELLGRVNGARRLVLDLSELEFIDSMGIHFLVTAHAAARAEGRDLAIIRGGPQVSRVFSLVGLDDVLPFEDAV